MTTTGSNSNNNSGVVIRLRKPTAWEKRWLSLDPRGNKHDDLMSVGFVKPGSGQKYSHPLIHNKTWTSPDDVVASLLTMGIPNASQLSPDRLPCLAWAVRTTHVDWISVTDAHNRQKGLQPALATHIGTDETIRDILIKMKVQFSHENEFETTEPSTRIYLAGALDNNTTSDLALQHGIHYVHSLDELRVLLRQTGSLMAPNAKSVGRRSTNQIKSSEKLVLQLWAATAPYELPKFHASDAISSEDTVVASSPLEGLERVEEPEEAEEEEDEDESEDENVSEEHGANGLPVEAQGADSFLGKRYSYAEDDDSEDEEKENRHANRMERDDDDDDDDEYASYKGQSSHHRVSLETGTADSPYLDKSRGPPQKKPRRSYTTVAPKQRLIRDNHDKAWARHKESVLSLLFNDFDLSEAGMAVYQVLELQDVGCREYDAVKNSIQRGLAHGHALPVAVQRTIDLLGRQCQRMYEETTTMELGLSPASV